jgi:hypothetical protein
MKYLILILVLASCGQSEKAYTINVPQIKNDIIDSVLLTSDSIRDAFADLPEYINNIKSRINKLEKENSLLKADFTYTADSSYSPKIEMLSYAAPKERNYDNDLLNRLRYLEAENARLKKRIYQDSMYHVRTEKVDRVPDEVMPEQEKPNDKSLVITLDKQLKGDGDISEEGVSVWIIPYNKQSKKAFKEYGNCQTKDLNSLDAKEASYYNGVYFFNDIEPGKYLIKVCALYGNCVVFKREEKFQTVKMLMSPPIQ